MEPKDYKATLSKILGRFAKSSEQLYNSISKKEKSLNAEVGDCEDEQSNLSTLKSTDATSCIELSGQDGQPVGLLLQYSSEQSQKLLQHFRGLTLHSPEPWHDGKLSTTVVDQFGNASPAIAAGLNAGKLYRVVGPPELVQGVKQGALEMVQSGKGALGAVRATGGGKIVGQMRFAPAAVSILAPVVAYQVLHAIVGTHQLSQINQRLATIEGTLAKLHARLEAEILGEIHYVITVLDDILCERTNTGLFTSDASNRLALVEKSTVSILERNRILVERFRDKADGVKRIHQKKGAQSAAELLKSDGSQAIHDIQCLVGLIAADLKLEQALLLLAMQNNPADVGRRQERIQVKIQDHHNIIENLPSIQEIEAHAQKCLRAMKWWEHCSDLGQTRKSVKSAQSPHLKDVKPQFDLLNPSLRGYVFWQDDEGAHIFSLPGDDLELLSPSSDEQPRLDVTIDNPISPGRTYKLRLPGIAGLVSVTVDEALEPGIWQGHCDNQDDDRTVIIRQRTVCG